MQKLLTAPRGLPHGFSEITDGEPAGPLLIRELNLELLHEQVHAISTPVTKYSRAQQRHALQQS